MRSNFQLNSNYINILLWFLRMQNKRSLAEKIQGKIDLPNDAVAENRRAQVRSGVPNKVEFERVDDHSYISPNDNMSVYQDEEQQEPERQFDTNNCMDSIKSRLKLTGSANDRIYFYYMVFIVQIPFLFFDLLIAFISTDKACMDTPYENTIFVLRPWLMAIGLSQASFVFMLLLGCILRVTRCIRFGTLENIQLLVLILMLVKILIWAFVQFQIFFAVIRPHCSGGIFVYGVILLIIHFILLGSLTSELSDENDKFIIMIIWDQNVSYHINDEFGLQTPEHKRRCVISIT